MISVALRYVTFIAIAVAFFVFLIAAVVIGSWSLALLALISGGLLALGIYDVIQPKHAVLRNYPILGHFRYAFEMIRPEIRQYLLESDSTRA